MTATDILEELKSLGSDSIKKVLMNHGACEPLFGVKIEELQKIRKRIKKDYRLALDLFDTGNYDAMYLAGLIADDARMSVDDLQRWVERANCHGIAEYTVAWVASEGAHGPEVARRWIDDPSETIAAAGWSTWSSLVTTTPDDRLEIAELERLLERVRTKIHDAPNRVRYTMNGFVIAVGSYVAPLVDRAAAVAEAVGTVTVFMGKTACKVPFAPEYLRKVHDKNGGVAKKRKTAKC
ncbi:MAG: DNA alkylation repair protein [Isosphaeraceae bacterium]|nr:DNA alkylation repair protein [Isosphaeraceae bacterium]